jgi:RND family efflux transporter MFP subunit
MRSRFLPIAVLLALTGCNPQDQQERVEFRVPVFVREVGIGEVEDRIVATGTLRAPASVALRAETGGALQVARGPGGRRLAEGDRVETGQLIAEITGEEVRLAAATEARLQRYMEVRSDYESKKRLFEEGLIPDLEFRKAETALAEAKLEWEKSQYTENRSRLVTPISGVILKLARDEDNQPLADGQLVVQEFEVAQVAPIDTLVADVDLVGPDVARVQIGLPARVRHHAWEDRTFAGRLMRLAPALDPVTRTLRAEVDIDNDPNLLRPGMFVEVTIVAEHRQDVPVVPREAVTERGGRKVVFVVKGQRVNRREVELGLGDDELIEIRDGLEQGERIVVRGLETLTDGTRVRVQGS